MKIGVVSDTHGNLDVFHKIIKYTAQSTGTIDHWLHAGDNYKDSFYLSNLTDVPVTAVAGNCDYPSGDIPYDQFPELGGEKIWLTHGHRQNAKQTTLDLVWWGAQYKANIVVFGHTHNPYNEFHNGILLFNPGSLTYPRDASPTFGIITICQNPASQNRLRGDIICI